MFVINGMLLSPVGLHPPVSSLQEGGPVWCAPVGQWLLPAASHQTGQFIRSPGTKLHLLLTACNEHWLTARLASVWSPSLEQSSSARGSLCWIIVLLQHWDLGLQRKVFGKRMKKNEAWIFRHQENVAIKSLKKNNAFWRHGRALLLLSTLKCDYCPLVFHTVASTFKEERDLANQYQFPRSQLGFRKLRISLKSLHSELL